MADYCTTTQLGLVTNADELLSLSDDDGDGTADTSVQATAIKRASYWIYSLIKRPADTDLDPAAYVANTYYGLELDTARLAVDLLRERQGGPRVTDTHPVIVKYTRIGLCLMELT